MIGQAIAGAVGGLANVGIGVFNAVQQAKQFDYQKKLQQQIFQREDSAVQRKVADLKAAGLSPVLAASGAGAGAGQAVPVKAPQLDASPVQGVMDAMMASKSLKAKDAEISLLKSQKAKVDAETRTEDMLRNSRAMQASRQANILTSQADAEMYNSLSVAEQWKRDHPFDQPLPIDKNTPAGKFLTPVFQGAGYLYNVFGKDGKLQGTFAPDSDVSVQEQERLDLLREKEWSRINREQERLHAQRPLTEKAKEELYQSLVKAKERSGNSPYFRGGDGKSSSKWKIGLPVYKMTGR